MLRRYAQPCLLSPTVAFLLSPGRSQPLGERGGGVVPSRGFPPIWDSELPSSGFPELWPLFGKRRARWPSPRATAMEASALTRFAS